MHRDSELWFHIPDLRALSVHATDAATHDCAMGATGPALHLFAQGHLRFLASNGRPDLLVDPFDPDSRQRVYAVGHAHQIGGLSAPARRSAGAVRLLGCLALTEPAAHTTLADSLFSARGTARWLAVRLTGDGPEWQVRSLPRPRPPARWIDAELRVLGLPHPDQGEIVEGATWRGWCLPRFSPATAHAIADDVNALPRRALRGGLTRLRLADHARAGPPALDTDGVLTVDVDPDGYFRVGAHRWRWVRLGTLDELEEPTQLTRFDGPIPAGIDPATMPAIGQPVHLSHELTWLDGTTVRSHTVDGDGVAYPWSTPDPVTIAPNDSRSALAQMAIRAVEHLLHAVSVHAGHTGGMRGQHGTRPAVADG